MRKLVWVIPAIGMILAATPVQAQTYDPNYPVCRRSTAEPATTSRAGTPRWVNVKWRRRAARRNASQTPFSAESIGGHPASTRGCAVIPE